MERGGCHFGNRLDAERITWFKNSADDVGTQSARFAEVWPCLLVLFSSRLIIDGQAHMLAMCARLLHSSLLQPELPLVVIPKPCLLKTPRSVVDAHT